MFVLVPVLVLNLGLGRMISDTVCRCTVYLVNSCTQTSDVAGRQHLRSASQQKLIVLRCLLNSFGRRYYLLLLCARRPGIRYLTVFSTQHWVSTCLGVSWRHTFLRNIDEMIVLSALEIFWDALYKLTLYLLTLLSGLNRFCILLEIYLSRVNWHFWIWCQSCQMTNSNPIPVTKEHFSSS